jgi:hypothetical protein
VGVREVGGVFQALVAQPEEVEAELVAGQQLVVAVGACSAVIAARSSAIGRKRM